MRRFWAPALGLAIVVAVLAPLLCTNLILARGDMFLYFYPYWDSRAAAFLDLRLPLWTPDVFMGVPFLANPQTGVLYPLNWLVTPWPAPIAVKISLGLHALLAWLGLYGFARRAQALSQPAAMLAATTFALSGYLLAQAEHVNQFQALAWFPWLLWAVSAPSPSTLRRVLLSALVVALQVLAGHTQSVFVSGAGAALWLVASAFADGRQTRWQARILNVARALAPLAAAAAVAALLAAGQLVPTAELQSQSLRSGGLEWREAVSFSLDPRLLGPALLPGYSRSLFTEFVAYPGLIALGLAVLGAAVVDRRRWPAIALALVGLAFALGAYDPVYAGLAYLPPFNLFRVPARWLILFTTGAALLAGLGLDSWAASSRRARWAASLAAAVPLALIPLAIGRTPAGETGPLGAPAAVDLLGWALAWAALLALIWAPRERLRLSWLAVTLCVLELGLSARALPVLATLTAPEAYAGLRPALTQLMIDPARGESNGPPPGRVLSMSALQFDPGDLAEMRALYAPQLPDAGLETLIVATKHKEVLSPNLALTWGIPSVDGFDGGILPTRAYAEFAALFTGERSSDGRLREHVTAAPDPRWLALVDARWLIADKTGDVWLDGVYYDRLLTRTLAAGEAARLTVEPTFPADRLGILAVEAGSLTVVLGSERVDVSFAAGHSVVDLPFAPDAIELHGPLGLEALTVIDTRSGSFQSVPLRPYRLAHSGDVKIYEVLDRLPRAFVVESYAFVSSSTEALQQMQSAGFDPARIVFLEGTLRSLPGGDVRPHPAEILTYEPERVVIRAEGPGTLVLADANYPGWRAVIDGNIVDGADRQLVTADGLFRAVPLPGSGSHTVVFTFEPWSVRIGLGISAVSLAAWALALIRELRRRPSSTSAKS